MFHSGRWFSEIVDAVELTFGHFIVNLFPFCTLRRLLREDSFNTKNEIIAWILPSFGFLLNDRRILWKKPRLLVVCCAKPNIFLLDGMEQQ